MRKRGGRPTGRPALRLYPRPVAALANQADTVAASPHLTHGFRAGAARSRAGCCGCVACVSALMCASHVGVAAPRRDRRSPGRPSMMLLELVVGVGRRRVLVAERARARSSRFCWISSSSACDARRPARPSGSTAFSRVSRRAEHDLAPSRCPSGRSRGAAARRASPSRRTSSPGVCASRSSRFTRTPARRSSSRIACALRQHGLLPVAARDRARSPPGTARRAAAGSGRCRRRGS